MKIPEELTSGRELTNEVLKPIMAVILIHIHWFILLAFIIWLIHDIRQYLSTIDRISP